MNSGKKKDSFVCKTVYRHDNTWQNCSENGNFSEKPVEKIRTHPLYSINLL
jgi:hypothetical protein